MAHRTAVLPNLTNAEPSAVVIDPRKQRIIMISITVQIQILHHVITKISFCQLEK